MLLHTVVHFAVPNAVTIVGHHLAFVFQNTLWRLLTKFHRSPEENTTTAFALHLSQKCGENSASLSHKLRRKIEFGLTWASGGLWLAWDLINENVRWQTDRGGQTKEISLD